MSAFGRPKSKLCWTLVLVSGCARYAAVPVLSPAERGVTIAASEPPASAVLLGPVQASHGKGCGILGSARGTLEGATALLREAAARRGADFVQLLTTTEPYSGRDCFHQEYSLTGVAYRVAPPAPKPVPAAVFVSAAPAPPSACSPLCSPGYECHGGVCEALCNPACAPGQKCRADRMCAPAP